MTTKPLSLERLHAQLREAGDTLRKQEQNWQEEWDDAPNPFLAVERYTSAAARARRAAFIEPFEAARVAVESYRPARAGVAS